MEFTCGTHVCILRNSRVPRNTGWETLWVDHGISLDSSIYHVLKKSVGCCARFGTSRSVERHSPMNDSESALAVTSVLAQTYPCINDHIQISLRGSVIYISPPKLKSVTLFSAVGGLGYEVLIASLVGCDFLVHGSKRSCLIAIFRWRLMLLLVFESSLLQCW